MNIIEQIASHVQALMENQEPESLRDLRINSIACNVFGTIAIFGSVATVPIATILTIGSCVFPTAMPITIPAALVAITAAVALGILAYLLINYGNSYHEEAAVQTLEQLKKERINEITLPSYNVKIPVDLCIEIFSYLTGPELRECSLVNKEWYKAASKEWLWNGIVEQYAIGPKKWKNIANIGEAGPIPQGMIKILKQPCPFFKGKQVGQTHMLVWIPSSLNGNPLTLNSLGQFVKAKSFPANDNGYEYAYLSIKDQIGDKIIENPGWVLITKNVLPESKEKSYNYQKEMVEKYTGYDVPKALEMTFCIFAKYYSSNTRLFSVDPFENTRCQDEVDGNHVVIGGFTSSGLSVERDNIFCDEDYGIAAIRKVFN